MAAPTASPPLGSTKGSTAPRASGPRGESATATPAHALGDAPLPKIGAGPAKALDPSIAKARTSDAFVARAGTPKNPVQNRLGAPTLAVPQTALKDGEVKALTRQPLATIADFVDLLGEAGGVAAIKDRADELRANPDQSWLASELGPDAAEQLDTLFDDLIGDLSSGQSASLRQTLSPERQALSSEVAAVVDRLDRAFVAPAQRLLSDPPGAAASTTGPPRAGEATITHNALMLLEASCEFIIAKSAALLQGDTGQDIEALHRELSALKDEKKALLVRLDGLLGQITGTHAKMKSAYEAAERAKNKRNNSFLGKVTGAFKSVTDIISKVKSIALTPIVIAAATVIVAALVFARITKLVGINTDFLVKGAYAATVTIATILGVHPDHTQAVLDGTKAATGAVDEDSAQRLEGSERWFNEEVATSTYYQIGVAVAAIAVAIAVAVFTGDASGVLGAVMQGIAIFNAACALVNAVDKVLDAQYAKDMARVNLELDLVRARLAEVEVMIKALLNKIEEARVKEKDAKDEIEDAQDRAGRISENVAKAAESFGQYLRAQAMM